MDHTEAEISAVIGKMFTNCGDLELPPSYGRGCGFYPTYANMNHSCRANTKTFKYSDQRLEVRAQVNCTAYRMMLSRSLTDYFRFGSLREVRFPLNMCSP